MATRIGAVLFRNAGNWMVGSVLNGSPASQVLAPGDRLVSLGGRLVQDERDLFLAHMDSEADPDTIAVELIRPSGETRRVSVHAVDVTALMPSANSQQDDLGCAAIRHASMDLEPTTVSYSGAQMEWTSPATEDLWHERIRRVGRAFVDLERRSVAGGIRSVCRLDVTPAELADRQQYYREQGLILYPVGRKKLPSAVTFEHALDAPRKGQPWIYITALSSTTQDALAFRNAWLSNDHPAVGRLLGYPLCCTEFFSTAWACGYVDPVWQMACNSRCTADNTRGGHVLTAIGDPHLNPLLRYLGVRLVPHLAHSLDCPASIKLARQFVELGWALGYGDEMGWAEELLALPSEWSVQRGIARIKAPLFRFLAKSVPTTSQWSVFFESAPPESMPPAERSQTPSPSLIAERLRSRLV